MGKETDYVDYFYTEYSGRIAFSAGFSDNMQEIFPLVFKSKNGDSIGIIALGISAGESKGVHIYHIGAFISGKGHGNRMLKEICRKADNYNIILTVSPIAMPNGDGNLMNSEELLNWYRKFGFKDKTGLKRLPVTDQILR